jgi:hypothetical protein
MSIQTLVWTSHLIGIKGNAEILIDANKLCDRKCISIVLNAYKNHTIIPVISFHL